MENKKELVATNNETTTEKKEGFVKKTINKTCNQISKGVTYVKANPVKVACFAAGAIGVVFFGKKLLGNGLLEDKVVDSITDQTCTDIVENVADAASDIVEQAI